LQAITPFEQTVNAPSHWTSQAVAVPQSNKQVESVRHFIMQLAPKQPMLQSELSAQVSWQEQPGWHTGAQLAELQEYKPHTGVVALDLPL
jgi:hypothetical protein